ncbi:sigma-70 family RNA polymerase sigma factor [Solimonas soli]|uniref:sigma-70 family RNA polymerase sigma factor n=1 Tax=Solimonas soli TaxID=413479 RepID=UPI000488D1A4|nr:sigma-70 family RNA polymerase sigma factor [Solimonas soli]
MSESLASPPSLQLLYREHHGWLLGWLRRRLGCAEHAAELAQDTFLRLLLAPDALPLREPRPYLSTIARRLLIDHGRRRALEQAYLDALAALPPPELPSAEDRCVILETLQRIDAMLDGLPPAVRTAFLLAQLEGLPYAQIAARLGVSERTVKRYVARGYEECILLL